ncbi:stomatin-like protein 2, mitochondrial, partial [Diabrotica undecimpunctata]|uniref:stomatin-like protein 2, mitochondrial n=1 Tax=Diabrotica undecimpunctata TaxID=50387 RepID=UPI003B631D80
VEAERKKRAAILESEGVREADINVAEGKRKARILASEAERQEQINKAAGEAAAILAVAEARSGGLKLVAEALQKDLGPNAASLSIAEQYVHAFNKLARTNNTLILPANTGDVSSLVSQAMSIYSTITKSQEIPKKRTLPSNTSQAVITAAPDDDLAEYCSDEEDRKVLKDKRISPDDPLKK